MTALFVVLSLYALPVGQLLRILGLRDLGGAGGLVVDVAYILLGVAFVNLLAEHLQRRWSKRG